MVFRATYQARYGKPFSDTGFDVEFLDAFNSKGATIDTAAPEIAESPIPAFVFRWHQGAISFFDPEYSEKARKYALNDDRDVPVSDITYVNPVFSQSFGWTVESLQALGITAYALMSLDRHRSPVTRLLLDSCLAFTNTETQFPNVDFDTSIATTDGSFRWGNVRMIAMRGRLGYPVECVCYVRPPQLLVYPQPSQ
jgi:PAS domain-containing protein